MYFVVVYLDITTYGRIILQHIIFDLSTDFSFEYPNYFWLWCLTIFQHHEYLDSDIVLFYLSYTRRVGLYIYEDDLRHRFELVHANLWGKNRGSDPFHMTLFLSILSCAWNYDNVLYLWSILVYLICIVFDNENYLSRCWLEQWVIFFAYFLLFKVFETHY